MVGTPERGRMLFILSLQLWLRRIPNSILVFGKPAAPGLAASPGIVFWTTCSKRIKRVSLVRPRVRSRRRLPLIEGGHATGCELPRVNLGSSNSKSPETTNWADTGSAPGLLEDFLSFPRAARSLSFPW